MYHCCATTVAGETTGGVSQRRMTYIPHERVEGPERRPSCAKSLSCITSVATDVCPDHGHLIYAGETEDTGDRVPVMFPQTEVISQPLADVFASTSKRRTGDDERPLAGPASEERVPSRS